GHRDLESIKRFTGFGTGMCQGKQCQSAVARFVSERVPQQPVQPFTPRPPLFPTPISTWASASFDPLHAPDGGVPLDADMTWAARSQEPIRARARVVIIGGGVMGLALAYNLALRGETDVMVLERGYLCAGASGRNGGGVRMQWGTPTLVGLAKRSIELMRGFASELGINVWLRQGGYLFLSTSAEVTAKLERSAKLHNQLGVPTEIITPDAARELVPQLATRGVHACSWNPDDGVIFPWPFVWGYARGFEARGGVVEPFTAVTGFAQANGRITAVHTSRGTVSCDTVVIASGAWSPSVAALAGVQLPNTPHRHEICSSEPLKPFLGPLVSVLESGLYFSQSMRGEIVGGMGDPREPAGINLGSTLRFLTRYAQALQTFMPGLGQLKILRQWSGPYDVTPDNSPILGRTPGLPNLLQLSGFVGHGFMMAPAVAERMAGWMVTGERDDELFERFSLHRFAEGRLEREDMIIG
ncbi:MAG: FAD-dependent oxidoreductase, partial [Archangium sp.]|nr:FAD-dependent oxidoreductase [Archangium sp.]